MARDVSRVTTMASSTTKPVRDGERHQRQVVEAVAEEVT